MALTVSVLLHGAVLLASLSSRKAATVVPLMVSLPAPPTPRETPVARDVNADALLKNTLDTLDTLDTRDADAVAPPLPPRMPKLSPQATPAPRSVVAQAVAAARRKLSTVLYYPEAARAAGIEGDVQLRLTLDDAGQIEAVDLVSGSGSALLDRAALQAAYAMGSVAAPGQHTLLLPVSFRLR